MYILKHYAHQDKNFNRVYDAIAAGPKSHPELMQVVVARSNAVAADNVNFIVDTLTEAGLIVRSWNDYGDSVYTLTEAAR